MEKKFPLFNHHFKYSKTHTLMNADVKWLCMSALLRDWIWILIYLTEGVLVIASCNYMRDRTLKCGWHRVPLLIYTIAKLREFFSNYDPASQVSVCC